jgi:hypothetical protein
MSANPNHGYTLIAVTDLAPQASGFVTAANLDAATFTAQSVLEYQLVKFDRIIATVIEEITRHGKSSCNAYSKCECIADYKRELHGLRADRKAILTVQELL